MTSAWDEFQLARRPDRPAPRDYVSKIFPERFELHGDRAGADDPAVLAALARRLVIVALDRARPTAAGFRKATRAINLAGRLRLPILAIVDTPGADPSFESEYSGLASAIAHTFEALLTVDVPVVSIITGEGGSGGALALACGDVIGIQEHAVFSVIAPESAAEILHRDASRAAEVAETLKPTAHDLLSLGLADEVISEPRPAAHADAEEAATILERWLRNALSTVRADPAHRRTRYSRQGLRH